MKSLHAELLLLTVTLIWGATFMFTKLGLEDAPPSLYIIFRFFIALVFSLVIFGKHILTMSRKVFWQGAVLGLLFGGGFLLQTYALKYTTVSKTAFITGITVSLTPFVYWFVQRKPISLWSKIGVTIATFGLWIFTNPQFDNLNIGDILTLCSTLFWAFYITYMDMFTKDRTSFSETAQLVMMQFVAATPLALIVFFGWEFSSYYIKITPNLLISLAFNAIMASFVVTFIHTSIQRYTTPVKAALIFSLEPVFASILAYLVLSEIFTGREFIGAAVLMTGIIVAELSYFFKKK